MERLRLASDMSLRLYHRPLLLTDSGGKDSAVICKLAENAGIPFEIVHSHTTADAPETVYHVRKRAKEYELKGVSYTIHYPTYKGEPTSMWKLIPIKLMPPTRLARYCCAVLKETTGRDRFIVTGVRWAESTSRKNNRSSLEILHSDRKKTLLLNNDNDEDRRLFETCALKGKRVCNPIIDWQESDVCGTTPQINTSNAIHCTARAGTAWAVSVARWRPRHGIESLPNIPSTDRCTSMRLTACSRSASAAERWPAHGEWALPALTCSTGGWRRRSAGAVRD